MNMTDGPAGFLNTLTEQFSLEAASQVEIRVKVRVRIRVGRRD